MEELLFTPSAILDLLTQITELSDYEIELNESSDGRITLRIGSSTYSVEPRNETEISVDESVIDTVSEVNESTYEDMSDYGDVVLDNYQEDVPVESGILRSIADALLIGGMVKLTTKLLSKRS